MGLALDEPQADEKSIQVDGLDLLITDEIKRYADMSTVDYISNEYGEGFTVKIAGYTEC